MNLFVSALFWIGIAILVDGSLGLLFEDRWKKLATGLNIQKIALIEISVGWVVLTVYSIIS